VGNVVVATEAPDNEGTSITNMAESVATQVARTYGIPLDKLIWIEHYVHEGPDPKPGGIPETFALVTFDTLAMNRGGNVGEALAHPKWKYLRRDEAVELLQRELG
jgi:hypothetical protein